MRLISYVYFEFCQLCVYVCMRADACFCLHKLPNFHGVCVCVCVFVCVRVCVCRRSQTSTACMCAHCLCAAAALLWTALRLVAPHGLFCFNGTLSWSSRMGPLLLCALRGCHPCSVISDEQAYHEQHSVVETRSLAAIYSLSDYVIHKPLLMHLSSSIIQSYSVGAAVHSV